MTSVAMVEICPRQDDGGRSGDRKVGVSWKLIGAEIRETKKNKIMTSIARLHVALTKS